MNSGSEDWKDKAQIYLFCIGAVLAVLGYIYIMHAYPYLVQTFPSQIKVWNAMLYFFFGILILAAIAWLFLSGPMY